MKNSSPIQELNPECIYCPICNSIDLRRFKATAFDAQNLLINILECKHCNFAWQHPFSRTEEESVQYFESAYADNGISMSDYFNQDTKRNIVKLELDFIKTLPTNGKKLLDIGGGSGVFAELAAENDFDATVLDPAIDINNKITSPKAKRIKGCITDINDGLQFDIITLWDVIEHTTSPINLLIESAMHLKKNGWLVIATGNYKCANRIEAGNAHWIYQADHRWYFSPESLSAILTKLGFSDFKFSNKVLRPGWDGTVSYPGPSRANLLRDIYTSPLSSFSHISKYFQLRKARKWEQSGIDIFTLATQKTF